MDVAPDAHLQKLDVERDKYFSNLYLGTFSYYLTGLVKKIVFISNVLSHYFKYQWGHIGSQTLIIIGLFGAKLD